MFPRPAVVLFHLFLLLALSLICWPAQTVWGQGEVGQLAPGATVEREIKAGDTQAYQISLTPGQFLHLNLELRGMDLTLTVKDPDGRQVVEFNGLGRVQGHVDIALVADASGAYKIEVQPAKNGPAGHYKLEAQELRAATGQDRSRFSAQVASTEAERLWKLNTADARRSAIVKYEEALAHWHAAEARNEEAATLISIGRINMTLAQYQKALDCMGQALAVSRAAGYRQGEAEALANTSAIYMELGDNEKALDFNRQALPLLHALGNREDEATAFSNMGLIYNDSLHDAKKALEYYNQALPILQEIGNRRIEAITLNNIGSVYRNLGDYQKALDFYERALGIHREVSNRHSEAATLHNIGTVYDLRGEHEKALGYFSQSYNIIHAVGYRRGEARVLLAMAQTMDELGRAPDALVKMEEALKIIESLRSDLIGEADRATFFASSESYYKLYISLLMKLQDQNPAANYLGAALQANERAHARNLLEQLNEASVNLRQDVDPALLKEERQIEQQLNSAAQKATLQQATYTKEQLAASQKEIEALIAKYQELESRLKASSPRYAALTRPRLLGVAEIQQQVLDPDTVLLEYALGTERSYLWVVSTNSLKGYVLPGRGEIEKLAQEFYGLLTARARRVKFETPGEKQARIAGADAELSKAAIELGRILLGPVASEMGTKRLLIVSDGVLHLVPFAALINPSNSSRPLVLDHEIVSVPSASALSELRREHQGRVTASKAVAVLADPVFDAGDERVKIARVGSGGMQRVDYAKAPARTQEAGSQSPLSEVTRSAEETGATAERAAIPRLPFTRQEAKAITALIPPQEREEALDFEASRATAMSANLGQYRFIHFATHGFLNSEHPELSGVVLSLIDRQGREQDGFLRTSEIFHLKLPVELVTLSGCRTGLGKQIRGEGMVGLTQGFMYAGAARVMVSLWDVNDQATAEFMARFYKFMLGKERLSPAAALRATQVSIQQEKRWQSPYYWSAFVLQGEPR